MARISVNFFNIGIANESHHIETIEPFQKAPLIVRGAGFMGGN